MRSEGKVRIPLARNQFGDILQVNLARFLTPTVARSGLDGSGSTESLVSEAGTGGENCRNNSDSPPERAPLARGLALDIDALLLRSSFCPGP